MSENHCMLDYNTYIKNEDFGNKKGTGTSCGNLQGSGIINSKDFIHEHINVV